MGEYMQIEGLLDKVRSTGMGGISADDDRAVESWRQRQYEWGHYGNDLAAMEQDFQTG